MPDRRISAHRRAVDSVRSERLGWLEERVDGIEQTVTQNADNGIARAVRQTNVERDLREHEAHLQQINGSQQAMAHSLDLLEGHVAKLHEIYERQMAVNEALAKHTSEQDDTRLSKRTLTLSALGVLAAYLAMLIPLIYLLSQL